ncbi:unnamed protein product [Heterobilharzia americana]|nr:unnamed protein product [Heterobilharzia americana]
MTLQKPSLMIMEVVLPNTPATDKYSIRRCFSNRIVNSCKHQIPEVMESSSAIACGSRKPNTSANKRRHHRSTVYRRITKVNEMVKSCLNSMPRLNDCFRSGGI